MTPGELLFYGGAALLGLTVILAIVFLIAKPKYRPEYGTYDGGDPGKTQRLLNGYPTDRVTIRREPARPQAPAGPEETEKLTGGSGQIAPGQETEALPGRSAGIGPGQEYRR